jgi:chromosome segregation ATPase
MLNDERMNTIEQALAGFAAVIVLICTVGAPQLNGGPTREQLVKAFVRNGRRIVQLQSSLQTAEGRVQTQKAELTSAGNSVGALQGQASSLQKERDTLQSTLNKRISEDTTKIKELEGQLQAAKAEVAKLNNLITQDDTGKKLDAAVARANKAEDRIRELTLQLHNAGIWP